MKKLISLLLAGLLSLVPVSNVTAEDEGNIKVGVFLINWSDDQTQTITPELVNTQMFVEERSITAFYLDTTYGQVDLYGDVLGYFTVNPPKSGGCAASVWANDAKQQLAAQGIDPNQYSRRVFMWKSAGCPWSGKAAGADLYIDYLSSSGILKSTIAHEFGHSFGLDHANTWRCFDRNGVQVTWMLDRGDTCQPITYGDRYDTMGNSSFYTFHAMNRTKAGWLPIEATQVITTAGTYSLVPLEWNSGIRQLQVHGAKQGKYVPDALCLEVRQSYGWDQFNENGQYGNPWATNGIHVRRNGTCLTTDSQGWSGGGSFMLDATPNSPADGSNPPGTQALDYPLPVGQTLKGEGVNITLLSIGPEGATVKVEYPKGNR